MGHRIIDENAASLRRRAEAKLVAANDYALILMDMQMPEMGGSRQHRRSANWPEDSRCRFLP